MFLPTPFQRAFFDGQNANVSAKVWFWTDFRFPWGPKIDPRSAIFNQNDIKVVHRNGIGTVLGPPGRDLSLKMLQGHIFIDLGPLLGRFLKGLWVISA